MDGEGDGHCESLEELSCYRRDEYDCYDKLTNNHTFSRRSYDASYGADRHFFEVIAFGG